MNRTDPIELQRRLKEVVDLACELCGDTTRTGVYYNHRTPEGVSDTLLLAGSVPAEKAAKYQEYCQEKTLRLRAHPEHKSSYESRNPEEGKWGGGIRGELRDFHAVSGLPEHWDESIVLVFDLILNDRREPTDYFTEVVAISQNPFAYRLLEEWNRCH